MICKPSYVIIHISFKAKAQFDNMENTRGNGDERVGGVGHKQGERASSAKLIGLVTAKLELLYILCRPQAI